MNLFTTDKINFDRLKQIAFNLRWAELDENVIPLTAADSDFPCAPEIQKGLINYIDFGYFSYVPKLGYAEVRKSIAAKLNERKDEHVSPDYILPIDSAARGMYVIAEAVLNPGDEAIVFDPVDFLFAQSMEHAGAHIIRYPSKVKDGVIDVSDIEDYITPNTKMIGLCNPHNPLGKLYSRNGLEHLLDLAEKYDLYIMNDEIWSDIVYSGQKFLSILSVAPQKTDRVLSVYGFSKSFSIAGLRTGCIYCSTKEMFDRLVEHSDVMSTAGGVSSLSQIAAKICMDECFYWNEAFVKQMEKNRDYALKRISKMPYIHCDKPDATFLLFPDISETGLSSSEFADYLVREAKVAVVPGTPQFFGPGAEGHIRICLATSMEILEQAMDRLEDGLRSLKNKSSYNQK